jgi:hypothetical protein
LPTPPTPEVPTLEPTVTPVTDVVVPTMVPTAVPEGVYIRDLDGFTLNYPSAWELDDTESGYLQLNDPQLNLYIIVTNEFADEETNYAATLEEFTTSETGLFGIQNLSVVSEEENPYGADGTIQIALLEGSTVSGESFQIYFAYVEDNARALGLIAVGKANNIAARRTTLNTMVAQAQLGGDRLLGYDRDETLVLLGGEPLARSLDPAQQTGSAAGFAGLLYSGLVQLSPDLQVLPDLAERWDVSADGSVYTFTLRQGLTFADGRPLTATDVTTAIAAC